MILASSDVLFQFAVICSEIYLNEIELRIKCSKILLVKFYPKVAMSEIRTEKFYRVSDW